MSHSIHMSSIRIDTKSHKLIGLKTSNCPSLQAKWNRVLHYGSMEIMVIRYSRVLWESSILHNRVTDKQFLAVKQIVLYGNESSFFCNWTGAW